MLGSEHAKRLILQAPDNTRKASISLLVALLVLGFHLILSYLGTCNSWTCDEQGSESQVCAKLRRTASCRTLAGPVTVKFILDGVSSAQVICPWENAVSELRMCFALGSGFVVILGLIAISRENRKLAELCLNSSYFFCLLLVIAAVFDFYAVSDSVTNNFSVCDRSQEVDIAGKTWSSSECSHDLYVVTAYVGVLTAVVLGGSAYQLKKWKENLSVEGL